MSITRSLLSAFSKSNFSNFFRYAGRSLISSSPLAAGLARQTETIRQHNATAILKSLLPAIFMTFRSCFSVVVVVRSRVSPVNVCCQFLYEIAFIYFFSQPVLAILVWVVLPYPECYNVKIIILTLLIIIIICPVMRDVRSIGNDAKDTLRKQRSFLRKSISINKMLTYVTRIRSIRLFFFFFFEKCYAYIIT